MIDWEAEIARRVRESEGRYHTRIVLPATCDLDVLFAAVGCVNDREVAGIGPGHLYVTEAESDRFDTLVYLTYRRPFDSPLGDHGHDFPVYPPFDLSRLFTPASSTGSR